MLYLIQIALKEQEIDFVQLDGSLNLAQREEVLKKFAKDEKTTVLLMTVGSGSVG
jgi:SNF2 family DNA or RNA helicase